MGPFGKSYDLKAQLSEQEIGEAIGYLEKVAERYKFAFGFQPPEVRTAAQESSAALQVLKTKKKLSESEMDTVCSCLRREIRFGPSAGWTSADLTKLNRLLGALSAMRSR